MQVIVNQGNASRMLPQNTETFETTQQTSNPAFEMCWLICSARKHHSQRSEYYLVNLVRAVR